MKYVTDFECLPIFNIKITLESWNKELKLDFKLNKYIYNYIDNEGTFFHKLQSAMFGFKLLSVVSVDVNMYGRRSG